MRGSDTGVTESSLGSHFWRPRKLGTVEHGTFCLISYQTNMAIVTYLSHPNSCEVEIFETEQISMKESI